MQYLIWLGDYHSWAQVNDINGKRVMQPCGRIEDATNFPEAITAHAALRDYWPDYNDKPTTAYLVRVISPIK